jgi:predicted RNase H-like HicB family nuclease
LYFVRVAIHEEVLRAALRLCRERGGWSFTAQEVVRALPHLNESSVRTHIVSRCCINAPKNHPHKWDYFTRARRGVYEIRAAYRREKEASKASRVAERQATYGSAPLRDSLHATVWRGERAYVAECWELAVVTQGNTLDEVVSNLREALALHLDGEDLVALGLARSPRLVVTYESSLGNGPSAPAPVG